MARVLVPFLAALFAVYVIATLWQLRRALDAQEPEARLRESKRALIFVSAGVPLMAALIIAAL